jgi:hypothetical protein
MKKVVCIALTCFTAIIATAQIKFGITAGVNLANMNVSGLSPNSEISFSSRTDFNAGVLASIPLVNSFLLQPEIVYSGQGAKTVVAVTSLTNSYNYINVPVLFKYQSAGGLFAETGPQVGFLLSAYAKGGNQGTVDITRNIQPVDFSWAIGIGYLFKKINLGLDARYNYGLTNTEKGEVVNGSAKNSVFQFGLFYLFKSSGQK